MRRLGWVILTLVFAVPAAGLLAAAAAMWGLFGSDGSTSLSIGQVGGGRVDSVLVSSFDVDSSVGSIPSAVLSMAVEVDAANEVFVGTGGKQEALRYLQGSTYELVHGIDTSTETLSTTQIPGNASVGPPEDQSFWTDHATGTSVILPWTPTADEVLVITSPTGNQAVDARISVEATVANANIVLVALTALGLVLLALAILAFTRIFTSDTTSELPTP